MSYRSPRLLLVDADFEWLSPPPFVPPSSPILSAGWVYICTISVHHCTLASRFILLRPSPLSYGIPIHRCAVSRSARLCIYPPIHATRFATHHSPLTQFPFPVPFFHYQPTAHLIPLHPPSLIHRYPNRQTHRSPLLRTGFIIFVTYPRLPVPLFPFPLLTSRSSAYLKLHLHFPSLSSLRSVSGMILIL